MLLLERLLGEAGEGAGHVNYKLGRVEASRHRRCCQQVQAAHLSLDALGLAREVFLCAGTPERQAQQALALSFELRSLMGELLDVLLAGGLAGLELA